MIDLEYHKGHRCPHTEITCQEGFCSGCMIYLEKSQFIRSLVLKQNNSHFDKKARRLRMLAVKQ